MPNLCVDDIVCQLSSLMEHLYLVVGSGNHRLSGHTVLDHFTSSWEFDHISSYILPF